MTRIAPARPARLALTLATAGAAALLALGSGIAGASGSPTVVTARDDCDPATFNAALGPGACVGDGDTTFDSLVDQMATQGSADKWRFGSTKLDLKAGRPLQVRSRGGEFHTFSEVARFGGGCVPAINAILGTTPLPECQPEVAPGVPLAFVTSGVAAGATLDVGSLSKGTHRFECLIHPWMRTTVTVK